MKERQGNERTPLSVFISYAHKDEPLRQQLETHLSLLRRQGLISEWHDREVLPGAEWNQEIDEHLEVASIILLLISSDFLASDYCYDKEMKRALERHKRGEARAIPIILRPCDWKTSPFARLQSLPRDGKAITTWRNQDEAFLVVAEGLRRVVERQQIPARPLSHVERQNRIRLMKRVRATWIEGVLEHSLHQAALIALDLQEQPDALANPWHLEVQETNLPPRLLPAGTSIVQVYDEADGELLILGEPGSGKTTLLLELARTLLDRAQADERHHIPVVFNLSSWALERQSLAVWLVEELWTKYQVPRKVGQVWMDTGQVLLLLDGLDEVAENARSACVQAINAYFQSHLEKDPDPLIVCCRSKDYAALPTRVNLQRAVSIQPLTQDQIDHYLQSTKGQLEVLRETLREDAEIYELARRPLMLSILTLAYQGVTRTDLPTEGTHEAQLQHVFATYVERMLGHRHVPQHASSEQTQHWLAYLARQMNCSHQTVFYVEALQPDWLAQRQRLLHQVSFRLLYGLIGVPFGILLVGVVVGSFGWFFGGLLGGLVGILVGDSHQIQLREVVKWSWRWMRLPSVKAMLQGGLFGVVIAGLRGILTGRLPSELGDVLLAGLSATLLTGLADVLLDGFSGKEIDGHARFTPNQGIWLSARNGLLAGLVVGLVVGLLAGLVFGLLAGLVLGLLAGLGLWLGFGLDAFLEHFILRFWLWRTGSLPWNLIVFLDEAAERLLLRKVGSGYIFIHRQLLDYFVSLEKKDL